jgi:hypothetical protein
MRHLVISDTQVKGSSASYDYLECAGHYAAEKKPDVIIHIGDHFDMESLSSYDKGTGGFEGRRYQNDIDCGIEAMRRFMAPIETEQARLKRNKEKQWKPRLVFTIGNHEARIERTTNQEPHLIGFMSYADLQLESFGFEVIPYLEPIIIDGIAYCHYFTSGIMGRPVASARALLSKKHMSCVMGHVQDRDIAYARRADGVNMLGLFAGIFYEHEEGYLTPQTNGSWRGIWMLNDVENGGCDEMPVSLKYLKDTYMHKVGS